MARLPGRTTRDNTLIGVWCRVVECRIAVARGDEEKARGILEGMRGDLEGVNHPVLSLWAIVVEMELASRSGRPDVVWRLASKIPESVRDPQEELARRRIHGLAAHAHVTLNASSIEGTLSLSGPGRSEGKEEDGAPGASHRPDGFPKSGMAHMPGNVYAVEASGQRWLERVRRLLEVADELEELLAEIAQLTEELVGGRCWLVAPIQGRLTALRGGVHQHSDPLIYHVAEAVCLKGVRRVVDDLETASELTSRARSCGRAVRSLCCLPIIDALGCVGAVYLAGPPANTTQFDRLSFSSLNSGVDGQKVEPDQP